MKCSAMLAHRPLLLGLVSIVLLTITGLKVSAQMHFTLPGIPGESTFVAHRDDIVVTSFNFGVSNNTSSTGGGATVGKTVFSDLTLTKTLDRSSPKLAEAIAKGTIFAKATLYVAGNAGEARAVDYYIIELTNLTLTSLSTSGNEGGGRPTESFTVRFTGITWTYKYYGADGSLKETVTTSSSRQ